MRVEMRVEMRVVEGGYRYSLELRSPQGSKLFDARFSAVWLFGDAMCNARYGGIKDQELITCLSIRQLL